MYLAIDAGVEALDHVRLLARQVVRLYICINIYTYIYTNDEWRDEWHDGLVTTASEQRGNNLKGFKDFYLPECGLDCLIC